MKVKIMTVLILLSLVLCAQEAKTLTLHNWLTLGPIPLTAGEASLLGDAKGVLAQPMTDMASLRPGPGWVNGPGTIQASKSLSLAFWALYLDAARFCPVSLEINCPLNLEIYLDGQRLASGLKAKPLVQKLALKPGRHALLIKGAFTADEDRLVTMEAKLSGETVGAITPLTLVSGQKLEISHLLHAVNVSSVHLSPDGRRVAVNLSQTPLGGGPALRWLEILDTNRGNRLYSSQQIGDVQNFQWLPDSDRFTFTRSEKDKTSIWQYTLSSLQTKLLLGGLEQFNGYQWSDDARLCLIGFSKPLVAQDKGYNYVREIEDRATFPRQTYSWSVFYPASNLLRPLIKDSEGSAESQISPDGKKILFYGKIPDVKKRPFQKGVFQILDLATGQLVPLLEELWIESAIWAPDNKRLLLIGGPSAFANLGRVVKGEEIISDFDHQAYIFDIASRQVTALTRGFNPSINSASWIGDDVLLRTVDRQRGHIYRYSEKNRKFTLQETGVDSIDAFDYSKRRSAVFWGSSLGNPHKLYKIDFGGRANLLLDYNREHFAPVTFGKNEDWSFKNRIGTSIDGYIVYPPDFSPASKYPTIVYYYGGTNPVGRDFGGRYPKDWYAANGYLVYVLQPRGCVGYGQEFSAVHVNDWGRIAADDIQDGVEAFIKAHPFVDPTRIGAMGASYGGFMTQYLATQTDRFAALISHAGISALSSYWGGGDWGVNYSAVASADSFPWNRKNVYVGHSPLFMADLIKTPLLLLHGDADNNVPPAESYQMFSALKILGKETALVTFAGQQHFILEYSKRVRWMETIMAWFDKYLKGQPEYWQEMYAEKKEK